MKQIYAVLIILLLFSGVGEVYCSDFPRHVDSKVVVRDNPTSTILFEQYSQIYNLIISGDYAAALDSINVMSKVTATQEISESINRFNELLSEIIEELNQTERAIDSGNNYLKYLLDTESEFQFSDAFQNLLSANYSSQELGIESVTLASLLAGDLEDLLEGKKQLDEYIDYIYDIIDDGFEEITSIKERKVEGLKNSFLDLEVDDNTPVLGEYIVLGGVLRDNESLGLPGKNLEIFINDDYWDSVNTSESGAFSYDLEVPYVYRKNMVVRVEYYPIGADVVNFTPAFNRVILAPVFFTPKITVDMPQIMFPGLSYTLVGRVDIYEINRTFIELELFYKTSTTIIDKRGGFSFQILISENQPLGQYTLKLLTDAQGLTGPGLLVKKYNIERLKSQIIIDRLIFPILFGPIEVSGVVTSQGNPVPDSLVECKFGSDVIETVTDKEGVYVARFENSPLFPSSRKMLTVFVKPIEPWIGETQIADFVTVLNLLTLVPLCIILVGYIYNQRPKQVIVVTGIEVKKPDIITPSLKGFSRIYSRALDIMSNITGIFLLQTSTMREYLEVIKPRLGKSIFKLFAKLTQMYEMWFYGPNKNMPPLRTSKLIVDKMEDQDE